MVSFESHKNCVSLFDYNLLTMNLWDAKVAIDILNVLKAWMTLSHLIKNIIKGLLVYIRQMEGGHLFEGKESLEWLGKWL